ncbi:hypothetical protein [Alicyclobacillus fodiniaquatilis]|jgi:hypothetical protein|uniref:Uncharacterized protein n=1 Tax=Alicyclobacillus fodiniaquatilis TaxID=1661150 RepID=A0ABW4JEP4_9BACL
MENYSEDAKEVYDLLDITSRKVPELISGILKTLYSEQAGSDLGKAVGSLYKELTSAGIPEEVALKMASNYMISLKDVIKHIKPSNEKEED